MTNTKTIKLGTIQAGALEIYVLDVAHGPVFGLVLEGSHLTYSTDHLEHVISEITDGLNSADCDAIRKGTNGESRKYARQDRDALQALTDRIRKSVK